MRFLLQCPGCKNTMLFERQNKGLLLQSTKKRCVYCGRSFGALKAVQKKA